MLPATQPRQDRGSHPPGLCDSRCASTPSGRRGESDLRAGSGPAFSLPQLGETISEVTGTKVTCRDLQTGEYVGALQRTRLDEGTARFVAAL